MFKNHGILVQAHFQFWIIFEAATLSRQDHVGHLIAQARSVFFYLSGLVLKKVRYIFGIDTIFFVRCLPGKWSHLFFQDWNKIQLFIISVHRQIIIPKIQYCGLLYHSKKEQMLNVLSTGKRIPRHCCGTFSGQFFFPTKPYREREYITIQRLD